MKEFNESVLSFIIIGDNNNKKFDGVLKYNGQKSGFFYHRDSIWDLIRSFRNLGYYIDNVNSSIITEAGYDLITKGHILFCNCTIDDNYFGYLFLPNKLTNGQIEALQKFENILNQFETLHIMKVDPNNYEFLNSNEHSYNFNIKDLTIEEKSIKQNKM